MAVSSPGQRRKLSPAPWHGLFLSMLPTIRRHAEGAFGHLRHDHCDDFDDALSERDSFHVSWRPRRSP